MGGKNSNESINRYKRKAYDRITIEVKKGQKANIQAYANSKGYNVNSFIKKLIADEMGEALVTTEQQEK